jgi:ADP-ribose pyrophosphatase YjhB (NUDIX family)
MYQKHILDMLRSNEAMRYSELQPRDVESSHFKYHLNQLIKDKHVEQVSRGVYHLTTTGKAYVDRLSEDSVNLRVTPKVITYTILHDDRHYFLQRKSKEPYIHLLNFIGGKVHMGESTKDAAIRDVYEKTQTNIETVTPRGVAEIRITKDGTLLSHVIAYIYSAQVTTQPDDTAEIEFEDIKLLKDLAPDVISVLDALSPADGYAVFDLAINV